MIKHSKLTSYKIKKILRLFCADIPAVKAAQILDFNRKTVDRYYNIFREKIVHASECEMRQLTRREALDQVCVDTKSLYKLCKKNCGKIPVFGIIKRGDKVFVSLVKDCAEINFQEQQEPAVVQEVPRILAHGTPEYDGFLFNTYDHYRVYATYNKHEQQKKHLTGIETFWSFAKRRLSQFNGVAPHKFNLYLKECEFRFNCRKDNLYDKMLTVMRKF